MQDSNEHDQPHSTQRVPGRHTIKVGRAAFLGLAGLTSGALLLGKQLPSSLPILSTSTNDAGFQIYNIASFFPTFDPATYRLHIAGMVEEERSYSYAEILAMPSVKETRFFRCVTGWAVPQPEWQGIRLWDLVQASRPAPGAKALRFLCLDKAYSESLTFQQAQQRDVLLAFGLNGKPLSREMGSPLRLAVPGMYGYKFAKWVNRIEVIDHVIPGYWEQNGYDVDAYIGHSNGA